MATKFEYAALAALVYNDQRGGGNDSVINTLELPVGWQDLSFLGFTAGENLNSNPFSFTGGAYLNRSTGEIVIAYKGTDFLTDFSEGRSWNTVADLVTDVGLAVARTSLGVYNLQQLAASSYFLAVKDWAAKNGYDGNKISFTGHSLGGGLAANMAVWFERSATTFAEAPFELSAINPAAVTAAAATLTLQAGATASAAVLEEITKLALLVDVGGYETRQNAVTIYYNKGEFLQYGRAALPTVVGTDIVIDIGNQSLLDAVALHSMNLHAAFLFDDRLRELAKTIPELIPALIDKSLFAVDPNRRTRDLITSLVNDQLRQGFDADSALKRFTTDIDQLKGVDGAAATKTWRKALIAVAMDYHYNADASTSKTFFTAGSGSIHFNLDDINTQSLKSLPLLLSAASSTATGGDPFSSDNVRNASGWHVQIGAGAMNWQDSNGISDVAIGGAHEDVLHAGAGEDYVVGGDGADVLDGGNGDDVLLGGEGADTYLFSGAFGKDTILDIDGLGQIKIKGLDLGELKGDGSGGWKSTLTDNTVVILKLLDDTRSSTGKKLVIQIQGDSNNTITINNFDESKARSETGYLGIKLGDRKLAVTEAGAELGTGQTNVNYWSGLSANLSDLDGKSSSMTEGTARSFLISLNQAAKAGDTVTLNLTGLQAQAILGDRRVDANGAVIALADGQTTVSVALLVSDDISADITGSLSVTYRSGEESVTSNSWNLNVKDAGEAAKTFIGDQRAQLWGVELQPEPVVDEEGNVTQDLIGPDDPRYNTYAWSRTEWTADGTLTGGVAQADFNDVITGTDENDKIQGLGGNDALDGRAGDDRIEGGDGDDVIGGGEGSDNIRGGAGNDFILSAHTLTVQQRRGVDDTWNPPGGELVLIQGSTWGVYVGTNGVEYIAGAGPAAINSASDVIDAGDGNDLAITGNGGDRVDGAAGCVARLQRSRREASNDKVVNGRIAA